MTDFGSERSNPWNIYTSSDPSPSQTGVNQEAPWKNFGTSMNAISFGFVATAILISMFLIMAIFEHLFRPGPSYSSPANMANGSPESRAIEKLGRQAVTTSYASDFSVLMPGQNCPTYIAQPAPLPARGKGFVGLPMNIILYFHSVYYTCPEASQRLNVYSQNDQLSSIH